MNYKHKREMILYGDMKKVLLTLAFPIMFNNLVQTLYNLADTYWVSKLGAVEVAATGFVWPVLFLMISFGMGVTIAGTSLISQYIGSNQKKEANLIASQIFSFSIILSIALAAIGYFITPFVVKLMGADNALFTNSCIYLKIMFLDVPCLFIFLVFGAIRQAQGDTFTPMVLSTISVITNVILDPLFILKLNMGIKGAAIATVISKLILTPYIIYILFTNHNGVHLTRKNLKLQKSVINKILKVGLPSSIGQSGAALGFIILNIFIVLYGNDTLAAFNIGNKINSIVMMPAMGIGSALASIIGQNLGADQTSRAKHAFKTAIIISTIFSIVGGAILFLFAGNVIKVFVPNSKDAEVIIQGQEYLKIISACLPLIGIFQILRGTFQGSGHTFYSMFMDMGRLWLLRLPMIVCIQRFTNLGPTSIWYSMVLSNAIICGIGMLIYLSGKWQNKVIHNKISA
ncbi:MATE family efflux transporter [Clostridium ganghwense]|uniref:MATE family efflux transporter n=1 Tax=Clostridium ganghwense TaxID=312089 RepID=A0ABT4CJ74_9CLOT|nr:MATE family efflux transporter [Clostridium ganghwense]MCY6369097.1 MATE family efflux transporter [Clostridium ganghwense]